MADTKFLRDMATVLRARSVPAATPLKYTKGKWTVRDGVIVTHFQLVARPDWLIRGWQKWWDRRLVDLRVGYVGDDYQPPARTELGDQDKEAWATWNNGRDPWEEQIFVPFFNAVNGEQYLWGTGTAGGKSAIATLITAYADRVDAKPDDGKILPLVELGTSSYPHRSFGEVAVPTLDIMGWAAVPTTPRPPLPLPPPPPAPALLVSDDDTVPF